MVLKNGQKEKIRIIKINESIDEKSTELSVGHSDNIPSVAEILNKIAEPMSKFTEEMKRIRQTCGGSVEIECVREIIEEG